MLIIRLFEKNLIYLDDIKASENIYVIVLMGYVPASTANEYDMKYSTTLNYTLGNYEI